MNWRSYFGGPCIQHPMMMGFGGGVGHRIYFGVRTSSSRSLWTVMKASYRMEPPEGPDTVYHRVGRSPTLLMKPLKPQRPQSPDELSSRHIGNNSPS